MEPAYFTQVKLFETGREQDCTLLPTLLGSAYQMVEFEHSTRRAADAAKAIGCEVRSKI